jgi:hypothetical protein
VLLVPALYLRAASHPAAGPAFALSSVARPAPAPASAVAPPVTWLPPERIVVEPEVVPYEPAAPVTTLPRSVAVAAPAPARSRSADAPAIAAGGTTTTVTATSGPTGTASGASTTTTPTTTTTVPVLVTLPAALTPLLPASTGAVTPADRGPATWFHAPDGTCAHRTIPKGTVVTVTRVATGATTTCVVDDWGPADTSRVIDLSLDTFEKLASPDSGVIDVTLSW